MPTDVIIVAVEPSGDALGAALASSIGERATVKAIGGSALAQAGHPSLMDISGLAILGFTEGIRALAHVRQKVREAAEIILEEKPRAVMLIDSWGFMVRLAKRLKAKGYTGQVVKYVSPQVWATRPGRAKILALHVDHLLSTQPMDAPCYEGTGLPLTYVGNPVFDTDYRVGDAAAFRTKYAIEDGTTILGVFPGSRDAELTRLLPTFETQTQRIRASVPDVAVVWIVADAVADRWTARIAAAAGEGARLIPQADALDAMAAMDAALATSGTITTQLACAGVPTVVIYKLSALTFAVAKRLFRPAYISIVNIAAEAELMPEFMQDDADAPDVAETLIRYLSDDSARQAASAALIAQTDQMGAGQQNASDLAAEALLELLGEGRA